MPSYLDPSEARQVIYFALASGVGWIVPKQYIGQVSDEGFKQHPIGLGP